MPRRDIFDNKPLVPNETFYDEELEYIWFETKLDFLPQIGWSIACDFHGFDWNEDTFPMIVSILFSMKLNLFIVDLDWGLNNQFELVREIRRLCKKTDDTGVEH